MMQRLTELQYVLRNLISNHCVARSVSLGVWSAVKYGKYTDDFDSVLKSLYKSYSADRK
jgi:hypothetical protein